MNSTDSRTAEEIYADNCVNECRCHEMYKSRRKIDPDCFMCNHKQTILDMMEQIRSTPIPSTGMKWVKFNPDDKETLPPFGANVFIKYETVAGCWDKETGDRNNIVDLYQNGWQKIYWLDESTPSSDLKAIVEKVKRENPYKEPQLAAALLFKRDGYNEACNAILKELATSAD